MGLSGLKNKYSKSLPSYVISKEEWKWYKYCVDNNIRLSPYGIQNNFNNWHIAVNVGPYKKGEKPNLSPSKYCSKTIWPEFFKMCKYYYDKYRK